MDANQIFAAAASFTVTAGGVAAFLKWGLPRWRKRRERTEQLDYLLHGKPDVVDAQNRVVEKGHAAIGVQLADLVEVIGRQLTPNGGSSIADRVTRIDGTVAELRADQQVIKAETAEARALAGEAATIADQVAQKHDDGLNRLEQKIETVDRKVDDLQNKTSERLIETEEKAQHFLAIAQELGMPWTERDDPDSS